VGGRRAPPAARRALLDHRRVEPSIDAAIALSRELGQTIAAFALG